MLFEIRARLWDIKQASQDLIGFARGKKYDDYLADPMLRAAVERKLEIIGEAVHQVASIDRTIAANISNHRQIIGLRHRLIHGYAQVDDAIVWNVVYERVPALLHEIDALLAEVDSPDG